MLPTMYDELWVGAKGMYKTEPAIADGGEVIIYAPHLHDVSVVHGKVIRQIGYHVRDYFVAQWDKFKHLPWGVLAHSTHLKGQGTYVDGVEQPRIRVTLATGIPEAECRAINLGYLDHRSVDPQSFAGRESEGVSVPAQGWRIPVPGGTTQGLGGRSRSSARRPIAQHGVSGWRSVRSFGGATQGLPRNERDHLGASSRPRSDCDAAKPGPRPHQCRRRA